jgi:hypothetical protein
MLMMFISYEGVAWPTDGDRCCMHCTVMRNGITHYTLALCRLQLHAAASLKDGEVLHCTDPAPESGTQKLLQAVHNLTMHPCIVLASDAAMLHSPQSRFVWVPLLMVVKCSPHGTCTDSAAVPPAQ